ncbi:MAG: oligogalacturonate lyase family protein [Oscillospiraceae bacterium]|jgi:oligogalacturonide lyase|nr:oligogalacturonate lyase family protein [Oscillospiraceae bacterium]
MNEMFTYQDAKTGYTIRQYTKGPGRNAKLYFTTENFTPDNRFFFFNRESDDSGMPVGELYKAEVETGELTRVASSAYRGFAMDRQGHFGVVCKDNIVCRLDTDTGEITELGALPEGGRITGHLTTADSGLIACSYHLASKIFALVTLDPKTGKSEVVYQSDYHLGHAQICPTDDNLIFYIHETTGDALQRTWMYDIAARAARPYYVEHPNEWITHEVWSADGTHMAIMKLPGHIIIGDKDGRHFDEIAHSDHLLHPGLARDNRWVCADRISYWNEKVTEGVVLVDRKTGQVTELCTTGWCKSGADHQHPSFDRSGKRILFNNPDANGIAQVCVIDLEQVIG